MDAFQAKLDALQKQSKEQITAVMVALQSASEEDVQPLRIAVAISNRLGISQIVHSFPVICLIDAMTMKREEACIAAVLEEFWKIAPSLFVNYTKTDETVRDKVTRAVKRWEAKKVLLPSFSEKLLRAMSGKEVEQGDNEATNNKGDDGGKKSQASLHASDAAKGTTRDGFTGSEVSGFCAILRSCIKMIERLPPYRANMYLEVVKKEKLLHTPTKSALLFFQGLHAELSRESALYDSNVVKSEHQSSSSLNGGVDTKAALGNLLKKLSKEQPSSVVEAAGGNKDQAFRIVRYISPLQSDICQRLSVAQRSGFGEWHRRTKNEYHYPKKESNTRRVFRAPAGSKAGIRAWFPSEQQWISESDMASLTLWRSKEMEQGRESSSVYSVAQKRGRDA